MTKDELEQLGANESGVRTKRQIGAVERSGGSGMSYRPGGQPTHFIYIYKIIYIDIKGLKGTLPQGCFLTIATD